MIEQSIGLKDNGETSNNTPLNNNDTLDMKQRREQSARELGISYKDSLTMSAKQLDQKIAEKNDPTLLHTRLFLEANSRATAEGSDALDAVNYMTSDTPESTSATVVDPIDAPTQVIPTQPDQSHPDVDSDDEQKYTLYDKANLLFSTALTKIGERVGNTSKDKKYAIGAAAILGLLAYKAGAKELLNDAFGVDTAHAAGQTGSTGSGTVNGMTQAEYVASGGGSYDPTAATGETGATGSTGGTEANTDILSAVTNNPDSETPKTGEDYNRFEQNKRDRMSTEGAFDGTERNAKELDNHVLEKIKNNPSLMASVLEVRESGNKEGSFSLSDVNHDTRKYSVHGDHGEYSAKGEKAIDTLERSWDRGKQGELLSKSEVSKLMDKYEFINHGTDSGEFKNAIDNKTYSAGVFDYRPDLGDRIYAKELGNGETVYFKVNEKDPTRDCLNVQTLREKIFTTPGTPNTPPPTTDTPPEIPPEEEEPPIDDDKKPEEAPKNHDNGNNNAELGDPTTDHDLTGNTPGGNQTNPDPLPNNPEHKPPTAETGTGNGTTPVGQPK